MIRKRNGWFSAAVVAAYISLVSMANAQDVPLSKPTMAVLLPEVGENVGNYAKKLLAVRLEVLQEELEKALVSTRKFNMVTRSKDKMKALEVEQSFSSSSMSSGEAAKKGGMDAANYLVQPTINDFVFYRSAVPVPNIDNKYTRQDSGRMGLYADVLDTTTGQIKGSFFVKSSFATKKEIVNTRKGVPSNRYFLKMAKRVGNQLAEQMLDTVFPIVAIKVEAEQVWINRGNDGGLKAGDILNIYQPGEALVDPYTGEKIGSAESYIGKLKVDRVNPKFTTGVVQSDNEQLPVVEKGYILRRPK